MIKNGRVKIGESKCTCGRPVTEVTASGCSCGNTACKDITPQALVKEAREGVKSN